MLVLRIKEGRSFFVGEARIEITEIRGGSAEVRIDAPRHVTVERPEWRKRKQEQSEP